MSKVKMLVLVSGCLLREEEICYFYDEVEMERREDLVLDECVFMFGESKEELWERMMKFDEGSSYVEMEKNEVEKDDGEFWLVWTFNEWKKENGM